MDCTGSMSPWIETCKKEIKSIIDYVQTQFFKMIVRVSIVGYRDFFDPPEYDKLNHFSIFPFDTDIEKCHKFLNTLEPIGNIDLAEDVVGGLSKGLEQNWTSKTKYAILIADYPTHGKKFYSGSDDRYPKGCPKGLIIETIIKAYASRNICFNAIKIT